MFLNRNIKVLNNKILMNKGINFFNRFNSDIYNEIEQNIRI